MLITPYSADTLATALSNKYTTAKVIAGKNHFRYLTDYLGANGLAAKSFVTEENYISRDFLHDYSDYYAFCFEAYPKSCCRIHFFDHHFTEQEINAALLAGSPSQFWNHYLGFIVVKPIPVTVIGYSLLKTYSNDPLGNQRIFWGNRNYTIHFFGVPITLSSLAFQEQDSVLAACATTAIWCMLNKAAADFHTILKSPSRITKDAGTMSHNGSRLFPNKGLDIIQICQAIFISGLVSEIKQPDVSLREADGTSVLKIVSNRYLKKILNAYSPIGIPVILIIRVPNGGQHGLHAITVSGFRKSEPHSTVPGDGISWASDDIERFYAHDDQWGPFTRIKFDTESVAGIRTPWTEFDPGKRLTFVTNIIVPLYPKIRISYEDIEAIVWGLDQLLSLFFHDKIIADLVWDIKIDYAENFKCSIRTTILQEAEKLFYLQQSLPKYLWIATCHVAGTKLFEFTFDATDIQNGMIGKDVICYLSEKSKKILVAYLKLEDNQKKLESLFEHRASVRYYQFLIDRLSAFILI